MRRSGHPPVPARSTRAALIGLVLALGALGCSRRPVDPVAALLASLESAAEARDAEALGRQLTDDFTAAHGLGRAETLAEARRYLAAYESVSIEVADVEASREAGSTHVRCLVGFSGRPRRVLGLDALLPPEAAYRFELDVVRADGGWLVRHAEWQPATPSPAPQ